MATSASTATFRLEDDGIAILAIDNPPVNALSHHVRIAMCEGVERALGDASVRALLILCAGRTFFAGADVKELGKPIAAPLLGDVMAAFEASGKPIVAAMHGTALGGGFELALAAHFRVAVPSAVVGLPEVALGLLPGAGGTQRVPRIVGVEAALDMIGLGRQVRAAEALELGLIDAVVDEGALEAGAIAFVRTVLREGRPLRRVRDLSLDVEAAAIASIFAAFRKAHPSLFVGLKAPEGALKAIEAAATLPFEDGIARERELSRALTASPESAAQRHLFFAERAAAKIPGAEKVRADAPTGMTVLGDGSVAQVLRGLDVPEGPEATAICTDGDLDAYRAAVARVSGGMSIATRHLPHFEMLAAGYGNASQLVGLHVHDGLWEIVVGERTAPEAGLSLMALARAVGIPSIFVKPGAGSVIGRLRHALDQARAELERAGHAPADIGSSARDYGFGDRAVVSGGAGGTIDPALAEALAAAMAREAQVLIEEGRVLRASDIDVAAVKAKLWPLWRGGPAYAAQAMELA